MKDIRDPPIKPPKAFKIHIPNRKFLTDFQKLRIIFLRYGDIISTVPIRGNLEVSKRMNLNPMTVWNFLKRHKETGVISTPKRIIPRFRMPQEVQKALASKTLLGKWAYLTTRERVVEV